MSARRKRAAAAAAEDNLAKILDQYPAEESSRPVRGTRGRSTRHVDAQDDIYDSEASDHSISTTRRARSTHREEDDEQDNYKNESADEDENNTSDEEYAKGSIESNIPKPVAHQDRSVNQFMQAMANTRRYHSDADSIARPGRKGVGVLDVNLEDIEEEWDDRGEAKITKDGILLGGRKFKLETFTLPRHPTRHYMLAAEVCRILHFRDSFVFFNKNPHIIRVQGTPEDKKYLEDTGILPVYLKRRPVSLATARSIFRSFGHKCVRKGKPIRDDYWVGDEVEPDYGDEDEEEEEEEPPRRVAPSPKPKRSRSAAESADDENKRRPPKRKRDTDRENVPAKPTYVYEIPAYLKGDNKLYKSVLTAADYNKVIAQRRIGAFYDIHTNINFVPKNLEPTESHLEKRVTEDENIPDEEAEWEPVAIPKEDVEYALAVIPGQYQGFKLLE